MAELAPRTLLGIPPVLAEPLLEGDEFVQGWYASRDGSPHVAVYLDGIKVGTTAVDTAAAPLPVTGMLTATGDPTVWTIPEAYVDGTFVMLLNGVVIRPDFYALSGSGFRTVTLSGSVSPPDIGGGDWIGGVWSRPTGAAATVFGFLAGDMDGANREFAVPDEYVAYSFAPILNGRFLGPEQCVVSGQSVLLTAAVGAPNSADGDWVGGIWTRTGVGATAAAAFRPLLPFPGPGHLDTFFVPEEFVDGSFSLILNGAVMTPSKYSITRAEHVEMATVVLSADITPPGEGDWIAGMWSTAPVRATYPDGVSRPSWPWALDLQAVEIPTRLTRRLPVSARAFASSDPGYSDLSPVGFARTTWFRRNLLAALPETFATSDDTGALAGAVQAFAITMDEMKDWVDSFLETFDADHCDPKYLPYIAAMLGLDGFNVAEPVDLQRRAVKSAVTWYKVKGAAEAFKTVFYVLGYRAKVLEMWTTTGYPEPLGKCSLPDPVLTFADPVAAEQAVQVNPGWRRDYAFFTPVLPGYAAGTPMSAVPADEPMLLENGGRWYASPHFALDLAAVQQPHLTPEGLRYVLETVHRIRPAHSVLDYLRYVASFVSAVAPPTESVTVGGLCALRDKGWYAGYCTADDPIYFRSGINFPGGVRPHRNGTDPNAINMTRHPQLGVCHPIETFTATPS